MHIKILELIFSERANVTPLAIEKIRYNDLPWVSTLVPPPLRFQGGFLDPSLSVQNFHFIKKFLGRVKTRGGGLKLTPTVRFLSSFKFAKN